MMTAFAALWGARGLALVGALLIGLLGVKAWQLKAKADGRAEGRAEVVEASKKAGAKANAKNESVRRDAAKPGALERLRSDPATCGNCGRAMSRLETPNNRSVRPDGGGDRGADRGKQSVPAKLGLHVREE